MELEFGTRVFRIYRIALAGESADVSLQKCHVIYSDGGIQDPLRILII